MMAANVILPLYGCLLCAAWRNKSFQHCEASAIASKRAYSSLKLNSDKRIDEW